MHFERVFRNDFIKTPEDEIHSSGYVVDTLEAAIWSFGSTRSYRPCVLKAISFGNDTDTVAAVAGGLAGMYYGVKRIPDEWLDTIRKKEEIEKICKVG